MFNKIDGTNVIINQNTNLIIITEISISYHLYALSAHTQIGTRGHSWNPSGWHTEKCERWRERVCMREKLHEMN